MSEGNSSERAERCETCRFWALLPDGDQADDPVVADADDGTRIGNCRRFPPKKADGAATVYESCGWACPVTVSDEWCGEWQARPEAAIN